MKRGPGSGMVDRVWRHWTGAEPLSRDGAEQLTWIDEVMP